MRKRKLVFFDFVTHYGGAQRSTTLLCNHLKNFYDIEVIDAYGVCGDYLEALSDYHIPTRILLAGAETVYIGHTGQIIKRIGSLLKQIPSLLKLRKRLIQQLKQIEPHLIWTNSFKALCFLFFSKAFRKYPVALYARGWYLRSQIPAFARWVIKKSDCVIAVSNATAESLQDWGIKKDRIHVVHTVIDFDKVMADGQQRIQTHPPMKDNAFKILLPGQLVRTKGQHTALEAAHLLKEKGLNFVMWLCGDVKRGVGDDYLQLLQKMIEDYGLKNNVFLLGIRDDIRALIRFSDVVILPTHTEGFPRAVWESMILKRPVVSTPVGGLTDLIIDGETGLLAPVDDARTLAKNIEKLILDKELYTEIVQSAWKRMHEKFSSGRQVELLKAAFEDIIDNKQL
jgi:glycosyltransferase involved in cell wall biosynthesis